MTTSIQKPVIVSASRATDIPAFYSDWFLHRLKEGYSIWTNPYNPQQKIKVSYEDTRLIVFWTKNPEPLLRKDGLIDYLESKGINCYIQYTLNNYSKELEPNVPDINERIDTFKRMVERIGLGKVIWRSDPLIITNKMTENELIDRVEYVGDRLKDYTEKMVFSFVDIARYKKVQENLNRLGIICHEFTEPYMAHIAKRLSRLNEKWGYRLATCAEKIDLDAYGIEHNKCIDDALMLKYFSNDSVLMNYIGAEEVFDFDNGGSKFVINKDNKDKGQRGLCGCVKSRDIGQYSTCPHLCAYCYANTISDIVMQNWNCHKSNPQAETITGK